ncbi:MAG: cyanoexosortase B [Pleurocapsa sp.]
MQTRNLSSLTLARRYYEYLIIALLLLIYAPLLIHWYDGWLNKSISIEHEYFSHGIIGFPFAIYLAWLKRKQWRKLSDKNNFWGVIIVGIGIIFYLTGVIELVNLSLPLVLIGICLTIKGIAGVKLYSFPLLLVLLATPNSLPYLITPLTLPLQKFIAGTAGFILLQFGLDVAVDGIYLAVGGKLVEVAPYCAGLKMLFTSWYVTLMLLYWTANLSDRALAWGVLVLATIISVIANIFRNTLLAFFHGTGRDDLFVWLHDSWGGDVYSTLMLGIIFLSLNLIDRS